MRIILTMMVLFFSSALFAQDALTVKGKVIDFTTGEPLPYATVMVVEQEIGVDTEEDGSFTLVLNSFPAQLDIEYMGYESTSTMLEEKSDDLLFELISMDNNLEDLVITVSRNKADESVLLDEQRNSMEIKQQIGAQELSRKGVSDVAVAVTKTTGVAKQEGGSGSIFVRGLGDRYNSTAINGLPMVSNNPDTKNIDLGLFSTDWVKFVSIDKVYSVNNYGDFGGANVDVATQVNDNKRFLAVSIGASGNTQAMGESDFRLQDGRSGLGFSDNSMPDNPLNTHNFTPFNADKSPSPFGGSFGLQGATYFDVGEQGLLNVFGNLSFSNGYKYREGINKTVNAQGVRTKDFWQQSYSYETSTTGMFNADYKINDNHKIGYNLLFINSSNLSNDIYDGYLVDIAESETGGIIQRNTYVQNRLFSNQLFGESKLNDQWQVNWGLSYNNVKSDVPDRTQTTIGWSENQNTYEVIRQSRSDNHRYFHELTENEVAFNGEVQYAFAKDEVSETYKGRFRAGYNGRMKKRDFNAWQFNYEINAADYSTKPNELDSFFSQENFDAGVFSLVTFRGNTVNALEPQYYEGDLNVHALYAMVDYPLTDKLDLSVGGRFESIKQDVSWKTQLSDETTTNSLDKNAFLPMINLKYAINTSQNLRFAASKTYTLPQFKERALFLYENVDETIFGNPDLYASDNYNVDLKWEMFPNKGELISATVFGKYIQNPINTTNVASSSNDITYVNVGDKGYVAGIEFELRKNLFYINGNPDHNFTGGLNFAYMSTNQDLDNEKVASETRFNTNFTYDEASFTGAADYLGNVDITYTNIFKENKELMATLAYNYSSDKIYALGNEQKGNLVDKGFGMLDLIVKMKFNDKLSAGISAKNLLNPSIDRVQENLDSDILVRSFKLGSQLSASLKYQF